MRCLVTGSRYLLFGQSNQNLKVSGHWVANLHSSHKTSTNVAGL